MGLKSKVFGKKTRALDGVNLKIEAKEVVVIIGPSGSGKSTLLRSINHLEVIDEGEITIDDVCVFDEKTNINILREQVGMVFQSFNLFPHLTILENVTIAQEKVLGRS